VENTSDTLLHIQHIVGNRNVTFLDFQPKLKMSKLEMSVMIL